MEGTRSLGRDPALLATVLALWALLGLFVAFPLARLWGRRGPRRMADAAYRRIGRWILERQEADGSWGGIQPPWVYSLIALHTLGYPLDHPAMARGFAGLDGFVIDDGRRIRMQGCVSPVWDTCLAAVALADAGAASTPEVARAVEWMRSKEITRYGDWHAIPRRGEPGGWSFEMWNEWYPDTDDTAEVIIALLKSGVPASDGAITRGVSWLLAMQSSNGGWGSFDVDNDRRIMTQFPVCDFGETIDWPTEDVTAHILEALAMAGVPPAHPAIRRGVAYLLGEQRPDGSWAPEGHGMHEDPTSRGDLARRGGGSGKGQIVHVQGSRHHATLIRGLRNA